ncbi:MAG: hypothetical protein AAGJ18_21055 [Bacteroidota bacterium]
MFKKKFWKKVWQIIKQLLPEQVAVNVGDTPIIIEFPAIVRPPENQKAGFKTSQTKQDEIGRFCCDLTEVKSFYSTLDDYRGKTVKGVVLKFYDETFSPFLPIDYADFLRQFQQSRQTDVGRMAERIIPLN